MIGKSLNVTIIGCGEVAEYYYLPILKANQYLNLVTCVDTDITKALKVKKDFNCKAFSSIEESLNYVTPDLILLLTNETNRLSSLHKLQDLKVPVFSEKPLYAKLGQFYIKKSDYINLTSLRHSALVEYLGINFNYRFFNNSIAIKNELKSKSSDISTIKIITSDFCWIHMLDLLTWWVDKMDIIFGMVNKSMRFAQGKSSNNIKFIICGSTNWDLERPLFSIQIEKEGRFVQYNDLIGLSMGSKNISLTKKLERNKRINLIKKSIISSLDSFINYHYGNSETSINFEDALKTTLIDSIITQSSENNKPIHLSSHYLL